MLNCYGHVLKKKMGEGYGAFVAPFGIKITLEEGDGEHLWYLLGSKVAKVALKYLGVDR